MVKRRRTTGASSNQNWTQDDSQTPEQPQVMCGSRRCTRSQTKNLSDSKPGHVETQHGASTGPQKDASVERLQSPKHPAGRIQGHRIPRAAIISYEEFCDGVHNYIESQHGAPTEPRQETTEKQLVSSMNPEHVFQHYLVKSLGSSYEVAMLGPSGESMSTRGFTTASCIWDLPEGYKVCVQFSSNFQPIKHEGGLLKRFLGTAVRKPHLIPINFKNWHKVPLTYKEGLWDIVKSKFEIPVAHEREIKKVLLKKVGFMWRGYKCNIKAQYFDESKSTEEIIANVPPRVNQEQWASLVALWNTNDMKTLSQMNKAIGQQQKIRHTAGTKSFAEVAEEMKEKDGVAPTDAELFIFTHKRKDGTAINEESAKKIAKMEKLFAQHQEKSQSPDGDIAWRDDAGVNDGDGDGDDGDDDDDYDYVVDDDDVDGGSNTDTNSQVMRRKSSRLSLSVVNTRMDSVVKQVEEDKLKVVEEEMIAKKDRRGKEVTDGTDCARGLSTPSRNTLCFSPTFASTGLVSEENMRQVEDRKRVEEDKRQAQEDRKQAEEDRKQAREDRKQAEEDRKQAEEDRKQAEEYRRKAEEERRKAEEDRLKYEAEIRFLKERIAWMENLVSRILPSSEMDPMTVPREDPHLRTDPSNIARMYSTTSSHDHEHCSTDQDMR